MVFQGASALNLDAKGRMSVPAKHRDALLVQGDGRLTLTKHPDGCLLLFPEMDLDSAGRVLVSPELRAAAGIEKEVILLGMGSHLELWDAATYAAKEQAAIAQGMPEALKQFNF